MQKNVLFLILAAAVRCGSIPVYADSVPALDKQEAVQSLRDELSWLQAETMIFSASRREQKVLDTPAAVYVITNEDIHRSGATSIPEALRMVPGLQVARINANVWAISSRGFIDGREANKLLVMIDGRTVYNPIFSGTIWRTRDVLLEDVAKIEVIRGPGAAMWGSNAVNGVINVITKSAIESQGLYATAGAGNKERGFTALRYGGKIGEKTHYRGYIKYFNRGDFQLSSGDSAKDSWESLQGGFRADSQVTAQDLLTLQGDIYNGNGGALQNTTAPLPPFTFLGETGEDFSGGNILGRWQHMFSDTSNMRLQLYYDQTDDKTSYTTIDQSLQSTVRTFDLDFQHDFRFGDRQQFTWGLGYRYISDEIKNAINFSFDPEKRNYQKYSAFIQDEITVIPDTLKFIAGSKFEHNDFSGFEIQPNGRLIYTPDNRQAVWAAISRAVRIPNRLEHNLQAAYISQLSPDTFLVGQGNSGFESEELVAYELGYRIQPVDTISVDIATFYNDYDRLRSGDLGSAFIETDAGPPHVVVPIFAGNSLYGETYGVEMMTQWQAMAWWRLQGSYSFLQIQVHSSDPASESIAEKIEGESPHHQFTLKSSMDLPHNLQLDAFLRYVDKLPSVDTSGYAELDVRLGWKPVKILELALVGQNLLHNSHAELKENGLTIEVPRGFYGQVSLRY